MIKNYLGAALVGGIAICFGIVVLIPDSDEHLRDEIRVFVIEPCNEYINYRFSGFLRPVPAESRQYLVSALEAFKEREPGLTEIILQQVKPFPNLSDRQRLYESGRDGCMEGERDELYSVPTNVFGQLIFDPLYEWDRTLPQTENTDRLTIRSVVTEPCMEVLLAAEDLTHLDPEFVRVFLEREFDSSAEHLLGLLGDARNGWDRVVILREALDICTESAMSALRNE